MKIADLIIVGGRYCLTTRAYLQYMQHSGYLPRELWIVDFIPPTPDSAKRVHKFIPENWVRRWQAGRDIWSTRSDETYIKACGAIQQVMPLKLNMFESVDYSQYGAKVSYFFAESYSDEYLKKKIRKAKPAVFLYTSGGHVPTDVLSEEGAIFLHIHPGVVPQVRGSDCLYWSVETRGCPGASCFIMSPGIDEGPTLLRAEYANPDLSFLRSYLAQENEALIYDILMHAVDPHLRGQLLVGLLTQTEDITNVAQMAVPQGKTKESPYLALAPQIRFHIARRWIERSDVEPGQEMKLVRYV